MCYYDFSLPCNEYYRNKKSSPVTFIVVSLVIMFVLNAIVRIIIGPNDIFFMDGSRFLISAVNFKESTGLSEGLTIKSTQIITIITTSITCFILFNNTLSNDNQISVNQD